MKLTASQINNESNNFFSKNNFVADNGDMITGINANVFYIRRKKQYCIDFEQIKLDTKNDNTKFNVELK